MKTQKRDSKGRFTSAEKTARDNWATEAAKKIQDIPILGLGIAITEGETITQILGKRQAEVERNTKHAQTNAEKYADNGVPFIIRNIAPKDCVLSVSEFVEWLSQPVNKPLPDWPEWPEWVKVGAWIAWENKGETVFRKIESISAHQLRFFDGWNAEFEHVSRNYKPARVRQFTAKEAVDLVGRTVVVNGKKVVVNSVYADKYDVWINYDSGKINAQYSADNCTLEDGKPCGVLEVVK